MNQNLMISIKIGLLSNFLGHWINLILFLQLKWNLNTVIESRMEDFSSFRVLFYINTEKKYNKLLANVQFSPPPHAPIFEFLNILEALVFAFGADDTEENITLGPFLVEPGKETGARGAGLASFDTREAVLGKQFVGIDPQLPPPGGSRPERGSRADFLEKRGN